MIKLEDVKIAVVGLGYVGLPLALAFGKENHVPVFGFDTNVKRVEGSSTTAMAGQASSGNNKLEPHVYTLPPEIDDAIAQLQLTAMGIQHDTMTEEQKKYVSSWEEGT